ncbi:hypothetical protein FOA52_002837 [Chlamydomonas sp. UWO 241]|nr:hypothetical protein FOA52_002837 [Chlamydomonas sp. UWO 241]
MRITIKGGVWKNTEDEILKAAVMKYGLNQWARISSLLVRKSAKQCKARWFEWLDPAIKKTEWTREEDEKLLHLAKLMPCQWRTIAPIVGRTSAQCLDRYERLLDMAVSKDDRYDPSDDPRRLKPGEIDPNPEAKPARPDAVDMDEDEKEMLSEARARLANTRGKKAKRKAREKQLEEARRLAMLQKKRELKAAGIEDGRRRKNFGVDYSAEVAFERTPAAGFFDTGEELQATRELQVEFRPVTVEELEGKRRKDIEAALVKRDTKRQKVNEAHDAPAALAKAVEINDASGVRRRSKMMLPSPQISEIELEQIARMSTDAMMEAGGGAGGEATRGLLGTYGPTPMPSSMMLPPAARTAPKGDSILQAAQNLHALSSMNTPLMGGANPELNPSDFSGITPRQVVASTPNPLLMSMTPHGGATPSGSAGPEAGGVTGRRAPGSAIAGVSSTPHMTPGHPGMTPGRGGQGATPMRTPVRDALGLNEDMTGLEVGARAAAARARAAAAELRAGLGGLPAPQNEYAIEMPDAPEGDDDGEGGVEDAAVRAVRRSREAAAAAALEEKRKSQTLQRALPRPASLPPAPPVRLASDTARMSARERAEELLAGEVVAMLAHDAARYPVATGDKKRDKAAAKAAASGDGVPTLAPLSDEALASARKLLDAEASFVRHAMGHAGTHPDAYAEAWASLAKDFVYVPSKRRYERAASCTNTERLEGVKAEYDAARSEMEREARRAAKVEAKVNILVGGLVSREAEKRAKLLELQAALESAAVELQCFRALAEREARAAPKRLEGVRRLVQAQKVREGELQERFKLLTREQRDLAGAAS